MRIYCLLLLIGIAGPVFSQSDFAVTSKGDTLKGEVKILSYGPNDQLQVRLNNKKKVYSSTEIITVFDGGIFYKTVKLGGHYKYMKLLKSGFLSLYAFRMQNQTNYDGRYLLMRDGRGLEVPNLSFKKGLSNFLENCPSVSEAVKNGVLGKSDVELIVDRYNNCVIAKTEKEQVEIKVAKAQAASSRPIDELIKQVTAAADFDTKQDALDLLNDLNGKTYRDEVLPNYLVKGLRASLQSQPLLAEELEKILAKAKK